MSSKLLVQWRQLADTAAYTKAQVARQVKHPLQFLDELLVGDRPELEA